MITLTVKERRPILGKIIVSRRASESEITAIVEKALLHGERGGVAVSGCISPGEQAVAKAVREASLPLYFLSIENIKKNHYNKDNNGKVFI